MMLLALVLSVSAAPTRPAASSTLVAEASATPYGFCTVRLCVTIEPQPAVRSTSAAERPWVRPACVSACESARLTHMAVVYRSAHGQSGGSIPAVAMVMSVLKGLERVGAALPVTTQASTVSGSSVGYGIYQNAGPIDFPSLGDAPYSMSTLAAWPSSQKMAFSRAARATDFEALIECGAAVILQAVCSDIESISSDLFGSNFTEQIAGAGLCESDLLQKVDGCAMYDGFGHLAKCLLGDVKGNENSIWYCIASCASGPAHRATAHVWPCPTTGDAVCVCVCVHATDTFPPSTASSRRTSSRDRGRGTCNTPCTTCPVPTHVRHSFACLPNLLPPGAGPTREPPLASIAHPSCERVCAVLLPSP